MGSNRACIQTSKNQVLSLVNYGESMVDHIIKQNKTSTIEDYYNEEHSPTPIFGTGTLEGYVTKNGVPRKAKIMLGSTNPIDGGFDYMISSNSDTSGHYKIDNIKLNLVNEFIRYEVLVTSNYSRLWKGAVDIYEGENNLNIEV